MKALRQRPILTQFLVVVVGILVAFALNAWWVDRGEKQKELRYLREIRGEFVGARALLDSLANRHQINVEVLDALDQTLDLGHPDVAPDSIIGLAQALWYFHTYNPTMPVYKDLVSSSGFDAITSPEVRRALRSYELGRERNTDYDDYSRSSMVASWEPTLAPRIPFGHASDLLPVDVRALARDVTFRNLIWVRRAVEKGQMEVRRGLVARVDSLLRLIDSELEPDSHR